MQLWHYSFPPDILLTLMMLILSIGNSEVQKPDLG